MSKQHIQLKIMSGDHQSDHQLEVESGIKVLEAASLFDITLNTVCDGIGTCGKCRVRFVNGAPGVSNSDSIFFSPSELRDGWRLGCQTVINRDCQLYIPEESRDTEIPEAVHTGNIIQSNWNQKISPAVNKKYFEFKEPTLEDPQAYLERLDSLIGPHRMELALLRKLPRLLQTNGLRGTIVYTDDEYIGVEKGNTENKCYGIAIDLGTTTLAASLINLHTADEEQVVSAINPQNQYGDDVISRIKNASVSDNELENIRNTVVKQIITMVDQLVDDTGISAKNVYDIVVSGNTAMEHLFCGINVKSLGEMPFVPVFYQGLNYGASDIGLDLNRQAQIYLFPIVGGFVGGDTVAGMLADDFPNQADPSLFVDLGTNGEIVLLNDGHLLAASTAAGPAFEGARLACGMRAISGAVSKVDVTDKGLTFGIIGNTTPKGICGSGVIDLVATLLRCGIVSPEGRLLPPEEIPNTVSSTLRERVRVNQNKQREFVIFSNDKDSQSRDVIFNQRDIRELQLAVGAIRTGISLMLKQAGVEPDELQDVHIAGGFGAYIDQYSARTIGLLSMEAESVRIQSVGNTALTGAKHALISMEARARAEDYARRTKHVELASDPDFQIIFMESMRFPEKTRKHLTSATFNNVICQKQTY